MQRSTLGTTRAGHRYTLQCTRQATDQTTNPMPSAGHSSYWSTVRTWTHRIIVVRLHCIGQLTKETSRLSNYYSGMAQAPIYGMTKARRSYTDWDVMTSTLHGC